MNRTFVRESLCSRRARVSEWVRPRVIEHMCVITMPHLSSPTAYWQLPEDESERNPRLVGLHSQLGLFI